MRQHVNPLSRFFQLPLELPGPDQLFDTANRPIHLDIGCARGVCLMELSALKPDWNHLGVEIRRPLVLSAQRDRDKLERHNLHYLFCNANISLEGWLAELTKDQLQLVSIQFPDPWFKRRHRKRRVMQPSLLLALAAALSPTRELFLQSDVLEVVEPMVALVELSGCFDRPDEDTRPWRTNNPLQVPTERERYVQEQGLPAYRVLYRRNEQPLPELEALEIAWQRVDNPADVPLNH